MRTPTPTADSLAWWRETLSPECKSVAEPEDPKCGFYRVRISRHGPLVPARIWLESLVDGAGELIADEVLRCEVNGREADVERWWPRFWGNLISEEEWLYMDATRKHAEEWERAHPAARPLEDVSPLRTPIPF